LPILNVDRAGFDRLPDPLGCLGVVPLQTAVTPQSRLDRRPIFSDFRRRSGVQQDLLVLRLTV